MLNLQEIIHNLAKGKNYHKVRHYCHFMGKYTGAVLCICNLRFNVSNEIFVFFHSGSYCDYHFFMKELASLKINLNVSQKIQKSTKMFQFR